MFKEIYPREFKQECFEKVGLRILSIFGFLWVAAAILELQLASS